MSDEITILVIKQLLSTKYGLCKAPNQQLYEDVMNIAYKERKFQSAEKRFDDSSLLLALKHDKVIKNQVYKNAIALIANKEDWAHFLFEKNESVLLVLEDTLKHLISQKCFELLSTPKLRNSNRLKYWQQAILFILFSCFDRKTMSYSEYTVEISHKIDTLILYYENKNSLQIELVKMVQSNVNFTNQQLAKTVLKTVIEDFKN